MATFADTLTDDEVKDLVAKHGRDKAIAFMDLDENSPDEAIKAIFGAPVSGAPFEAGVHAAPETALVHGMTSDEGGRLAGGIGSLLGVAAPFVAAGPAGAIPVAGGLLAAGLGGYGAEKGIEKSGLGDLLKQSSDYYRGALPKYNESDAQHPIMGGTAYNMVGNMANELSPNGINANIVEAGPGLAALVAGGKAAELGTGATQGLGRLLTGSPKVPVGQEANALLSTIEDTHGRITPVGKEGPAPIPQVKRTGEFRDVLATGRNELGAPVKVAKEAAYNAIETPKDLSQKMNDVVMQGLVEKGNAKGMMGNFDPQFSKSPEASADILSTMKQASGKIDSIDKAKALQEQFAGKAAAIRQRLNGTSPNKAVSPEADVYDSASKAIDKYIKSLIPQSERSALESANAPFSAYANIQDLALKANNADGEFNPKKFRALWNSQKDAARAKMDPEGKIEALLKQGDDGLGARLLQVAKQAGNAKFSSALETLVSKKPKLPIRYNAQPKPPISQGPLVQSGGLAGLLGSRTAQ